MKENTPRITRRTAIQGTAAAGISALTGIAISRPPGVAQDIAIETPPPATPTGFQPESVMPPTGPTIASKAAELEFDTGKIFHFVANDVRYEPYVGALRGAEGTLWSLAGNAVDKAVLFSALLDEAGVTYRFASAKLDEDGIDSLNRLLQPDATTVRNNQHRALFDGFAPRSAGILAPSWATPSPDPEPDADAQALLDDLKRSADLALATANTLLAEQAGIIGRALADASITLPPPPTAIIPDPEIDRHTWVQVADGPVWVDYAPAIGRDPAEDAMPSPQETMDTLPDDFFHRLTLKIVAEEIQGGQGVRRDAVTVETRTASVVNAPIAIAVMPPASLGATGASILAGISGDITLLPVMSGKGQIFAADRPVVFGAAGGALDALGNVREGPGDGETIALWLTIDLQRPGAEAESFERALVDRLSFEQRQASTIDYSTVAPVTVIDAFGGGNTIPQLLTASLLHISSSHLPFAYAVNELNRASEPDILPAITPAMISLRQTLNLETELAAGTFSFMASPHIAMTKIALDEPSDTATATVSLDLLRHPVGTITVDTGNTRNDAIHPLVRAGILDQVAEQMLLQADPSSSDSRESISAGMILAAANDQDIPVVTITSLDDLEALDTSAETRSRLETALAQGWIAIMPNRPVTIGETTTTAWWLIDPQTGETRDELEHGGGYASVRVRGGSPVHFQVVEDTELNQMAAEVQPWYRRLGRYTGCILAFSAIALGAAGLVTGAATGNVVVGAGGVVTAAGGVNNANKTVANGGCR